MVTMTRRIITRDRLILGHQVLPLPPPVELGLVVPQVPGWRMVQDFTQYEHVEVSRVRCLPGPGALVPADGYVYVDFVLAGSKRILDRPLDAGAGLVRWPSPTKVPVDWNTPMDILSVRVSLDAMAEFGVQPRSGWHPLVAEPALLGMAQRYVLDAHSNRGHLSRLARYFASRLVVETTASVLLTEQGMTGLETDPKTNRDGLYQKATHLITLHRADPALTPQGLAEDLGISVRTLQRIFAEHGTTVADEISRRRVDHAVAILKDPAYAVLTVARVATLAGFTNPAALRRAFAQAGLPSPSEMQAVVKPPRHLAD